MKITKIEYIWFTLLLLSLFAYSLGHFRLINQFLVGFLLITTFVKGQLIIDYFMNLHNVTLKYRIIPSLWLFTILTAVGSTYYF